MAVVSDVEIRLRADIARLQADMDRARQVVGGTMNRITSAVEGASKAFAGLAIAAGVGAVLAFAGSLKGMIAANIEATGSLYDLSLQTGASVAALSAFRAIGATSDTTAETLAGAMNKLSKGMAVANEESKGLPQAIAAIGLNFADLRKLNPEDQMLAIAKAFDGFATGAGKSAVAMALYGKEGAKLLPFLADLAAESDKVAASLTDQQKAAMLAAAAMADNFGDSLTMIERASQETGKAISAGMLPALYETSQAILAVVTDTGGLRDAVKELAADGSIANWTRTAVDGITYLLDGFDRVVRAVQIVNAIVGGAFNTMTTFVTGAGSAMKAFIEGDYARSFAIFKETAVASTDAAKEGFADLSEVLTRDLIGEKLRAQLKLAREAKAEMEDAKPQVDFKPDAEVNKELEKQIKAYRELAAAMREHVLETAREAAGLEPYNAAQKENIKLTEELAAGKRKLSPLQEAEIRGLIKQWDTNLQVIESIGKAKKAAEEMAKVEKDLANARATELKKAEEEMFTNEELVATFGLTKSAIEKLELARLQEQLAQRGSIGLTIDEIDHLENLIALKERSATAVATVENLKKEKDFWESIDKTAHDTFVSIADGGKGMWQRLKESAKNVFFDWLYSMTVKKWIIDIGTSVSGAGAVSGIASAAAPGASSALNLISAGQKIYEGFTKGFTAVGSTIGGAVSALGSAFGSASVSAFGAGMGLTSAQAATAAAAYNSAGMTGIGSSLTAGSTAGAAAGIFAGAAGGILGGRAISGGYGSNGAVNTGTAVGAAVGSIVPVLGTAIGALVGGLLGGTFNRAFGYKAPEIESQGLRGNFSGDMLTGETYQNILKKGGWFRSDKRNTDTQALTGELQAQFSAGFNTIKSASIDYAKALGVSTDSLTSYSKAFDIKFTKDAEANTKAITEFFAQVNDEIANKLVPNLARFAVEGEAAATTLQRLASNSTAVEAVFKAMGVSTQTAFGAVGLAAVDARERLINMAGGIEVFGNQATYFAANFLSKADQVAPVQKQLDEAMSALGYSGVKTIEQYKQAVVNLVNSGALATAAGADLYTALMALAPAFKEVTDYTAELRATALAGANEAASVALDVLGKSVDAQKNIVTAAYQAAMEKVDASISKLNDTISTTGALSEALKAAMGKVDAPGSAAGSRAAAVAQIGAALAIAKASGVLPSRDSLADALTALQQDSSDQYSTLAEYQRAVAQSNAQLEQLGGLTDSQLSAAEQQLAALTAQKDALTAASTAELLRLDDLVSAAQQQIAAVNGVNNTLVTVGQALIGVYDAARTLSGYTGISATAVAPSAGASVTIDYNALVEETRALNERTARMEEHAAQTAQAITQMATQFNSVSAGGNALLTEAA